MGIDQSVSCVCVCARMYDRSFEESREHAEPNVGSSVLFLPLILLLLPLGMYSTQAHTLILSHSHTHIQSKSLTDLTNL